MSDQNGTGGTAGTAPGTPSTPGQGGAWRDTTRDGTPVPPDLRWDNRWCLWMSDRAETRWYANGRIYGPYRESRESGADLIPTPTPAPSPVAEVDAGFTPGPWTVQQLNHAHGELWLQIGHAATGRGPIARTSCAAEPMDGAVAELRWLATRTEQQWANARLIAAAPDLYHALQGLYELVSARAIGIPDEQYIRVTAAAAALARATRTEGGAS